MRVTFFVDKYPCYSETFIQSQIDGLLDAGVTVDVIALYSDPNAELPANIRLTALHRTQAGKIRTLLQRSWSVVRSLLVATVQRSLFSDSYRLLRTGLFLPALASVWHRKHGTITSDIVLAHFGTTGVTAAMLMELGLLQGKLVTVFHGFELSEYDVLNRYKNAYRLLFRISSLCMPVSQLWAERLTSLGCPTEKITVHHMGIYPDSFSMLSPDRPLHTPLRLLSVARLVEKKGLDDAIAAITLLKLQQIDAKLKIIGDGPLKKVFQQQIIKQELTDCVELCGALPHQQVRNLLQDCDIFILPSKTASNGDMEGIPVSLMEAMARGLLVISTKHSGISELIEHNLSGFLAEENSPKQLAELLNQVVTSTDIRQIRLNARRKVEDEFNQHKLNQQLLRLLNTLYETP